MRVSQLGSRRLLRASAGGVGAVAAGMGGVQSSDAAVVYTPVDVDIPSLETGDSYGVDLDGDTVTEFTISTGATTVTKVGGFAAGAGAVTDPSDDRTANLALDTLIGPASAFSAGTPAGGDALNGTDTGNPVGHFQTSDGPGFIGLQFLIGGATHYGYVGYEGVGEVADGEGHVFALGYEDVPDTAIAAGAGIPDPGGVPGDYNDDGTVDAADYTVWRDTLGGTSLPNEGAGISPGAVDQADYEFWKERFGAISGAGAGAGIGASSASSVPEPTSLCLLAAGAAGIPLYRRRRSG